MGNNTKKRFGNLDLLRFVAMWGVITIHYIGWGGIANHATTSDFNFYIAAVLGIVSQVSVNIFYIISGYFLEANQEFRWKKSIAFYGKVLFYSVFVPLVLLLCGYITFDKAFMKSFFPITTNQYWFATIYLFLMLLLPFLNILFRNCTDKQLSIFLVVVFIFNSVQPMFFHNAIGETGYGITHAVFMVSLGYWIKRTNFTLSKVKAF
jgi:surface polysaccharide O-acyltransferase-like enzyme